MIEEEDIFFEPQLFENANKWKSNIKFGANNYESALEESVALSLCRSLQLEPFWLKPPILKQNQINMLYKLADDFSKIMREENLEFWMDGGTLLGSVRHGGLIPWDDDLDFSTFKYNKKKFLQNVAPRLVAKGYGLVEWWYCGCRIFHTDGAALDKYPNCRYPFADLFFMRPCKRNKDNGGLLEYCNLSAKWYWPSGLTVEDLKPLKMGSFGDIFLPMPGNPLNHLNSLYGNHWASIVYQDYNHSTEIRSDRIYVKMKNFVPALPNNLK